MKSHWILALITLVIATQSQAASSSKSPKEEKVGVGSGFAVGAAAGGPIGAIIGAAVGAVIGNKMHTEKSAREDFEQRFARASDDLESLEALLRGSERDLAEARSALNAQSSTYRDALREVLAAEIYFHTGDASLDEKTTERIARLGSVMQLIDGITVIVEGHADARGDADYNEQLSAERAAAVRRALVESGLPEDRVTATAAGETFATAAEDDLDSLALERRVQLNVVYPESGNRVARQ